MLVQPVGCRKNEGADASTNDILTEFGKARVAGQGEGSDSALPTLADDFEAVLRGA
jgi:hypothetical protein